MSNKTCVLTGATSGIGRATALALAAKDINLVLPVRDVAKATMLKAEIGKFSNIEIIIVKTDLDDLKSVRNASEQILKLNKPVDILINNAGLTHTRRIVTIDGYEATFAVNHLAPFLLTNLILPALEKSKSARIVNVSSRLHKKGKIQFENLMLEKGYNLIKAYNQSKLANVLFTYELARRLKDKNITVNVLHPGNIASGIARDFPSLAVKFVNLFMHAPEYGSEALMHVSTSLILEGISGCYFHRLKKGESAPKTYDIEVAKKLWEVSEKLVGRI